MPVEALSLPRSLFRRILDQAKLLPLVAMFMRSSYRGAMNITRACVEDEQSEDNFVLYKAITIEPGQTDNFEYIFSSRTQLARLCSLGISLLGKFSLVKEFTSLT